MQSTELEYKLAEIQNNNPTSIAALVPKDEPMFEIDLNSRAIKVAKEIINVETDHLAETIYFKVNRYFDNYDLSKSCGIVQFINADGESFIYPIPYFDIETLADNENPMMVFPWSISRNAAKKSGTVKFSIRFFNIDTVSNQLYYSLSTLPASIKIEGTIIVDNAEEDIRIEDEILQSEWANILQEIKNIQKVYNGEHRLNWLVLD